MSTRQSRLVFASILALALLMPSAPGMGHGAAGLDKSAATLATSTFDSNAEGWEVIGDDITVAWRAAGGNPGGYLEASDDIGGWTWYWSASAEFLGNKAAAYGGMLRFDLRQTPNDDPYDDLDLILEGGGLTLSYETPYNPTAAWTPYTIILHEEVGWRRDGFVPATAAEMRQALSDLTALRIRGKFQNGVGVGSLDNVVLSEPAQDLIRVPGTAVIFFGNRGDIAIPPLGGDLTGFPLLRNCIETPCDGFLQETFPKAFGVKPGAQVRVTAFGGMDYYGSTEPSVGPDGALDPDAISDIFPLDGVSGFVGPHGALVGLFLDNRNPRDTAPPDRLDFSGDGLGTNFATLSPALGQVFFIGDGLTGVSTGAQQTFVAPAGATRLFLGIADGFGFAGEPGAYDDNLGAFYVQLFGVLIPAVHLPLIRR